jgi:hypothetical protein
MPTVMENKERIDRDFFFPPLKAGGGSGEPREHEAALIRQTRSWNTTPAQFSAGCQVRHFDAVWCGGSSGVGLGLFGLDGVFNRHIVKFFRIKNFAALQAFNILDIIVPGDDAHSRVFADGRHGGW